VSTARLALLKLTCNLFDMGLDLSVGNGARGMRVVVVAVLESSSKLEDGQEGEEHCHHVDALGLAEVGHLEGLSLR
jgi:hypothetical protein